MQNRGSKPNFSEPWHLSDAILLVEGEIFHIHRSMLSMCSPVFERMFTADFREKNQMEIQLPGKKASEIRELLLVIYPHSKPVDGSNFYFLLSLADEYQMGQLTERCENYLLLRKKSKSQSIDLLVLAQKFNLECLRDQCIEIAKDWPLSKLKAHKMYESVSPENGRELAEKRLEQIEVSCEKNLKQFFRTVRTSRIPGEGRCELTMRERVESLRCVIHSGHAVRDEKNDVVRLVEGIYKVVLQE